MTRSSLYRQLCKTQPNTHGLCLPPACRRGCAQLSFHQHQNLTLIPPQNVKNLAKTNKTAKNIYNSMFYMLLLVGMLVALING